MSIKQTVSPRSLEKELIKEFINFTGILPELNKINK